LDVAWEDVKRELIAIAAYHGLDTSGHRRVLPLLQLARQKGSLVAVRDMERSLELAELAGASSCLVNEELIAWVAELPPAVPVGILSLNSLSSVERALHRAGLDRRISDIVARENVDRPKPHPEGLRLLVERHVARARCTVFVGDAGTDRECAAAAGVQFRDVHDIGINWVDPSAIVVEDEGEEEL
jgi:phosphoglycolate phosphatase-like HAD superfamily hydrolase